MLVVNVDCSASIYSSIFVLHFYPVIPPEIVRRGEAVVQRYRELLRKGKKKKMPRCNLIALGEQRVGKTCLLALLMGKEFIEDRDPTRGISNERVAVEFRTLSSETWKEVNPNEVAKSNERLFIHSVAEEFHSHFSKSKNTSPPNRELLIQRVSGIKSYLDKVEEEAKEPTQPPAKRAHHTIEPKKLIAPLKQQIHVTVTRPPKAHIPSPVSTPSEPEPLLVAKYVAPAKSSLKYSNPTPQPAPHPQHAELLKPLNRHRENDQRQSHIGLGLNKAIISSAKRSQLAMEPVLQYNTLDFAGQKEYRAMHHCFIVRRAIYLLVFNLQIVREAIETQANQNRQGALEEIQYWLSSIHAHVHKIVSEPPLKRVLLVGTHRAPKCKQPITEENMRDIDKTLEEVCACRHVINDLYRAGGKYWFSAIENSIDGHEESAREESGANSLQNAIHKAWKDLPFKDEVYPTTWLRFEAYLNQEHNIPIVDAGEIHRIARETYGIGEDNENDTELALEFFHDTGTIVYASELLIYSYKPNHAQQFC